jgi:hypothetical protein
VKVVGFEEDGNDGRWSQIILVQSCVGGARLALAKRAELEPHCEAKEPTELHRHNETTYSTKDEPQSVDTSRVCYFSIAVTFLDQTNLTYPRE